MMSHLLYLSTFVFGLMLLVLIFAPYARRSAVWVAQNDEYMRAVVVVPPRVSTRPQISLDPIPLEETASHHLKKAVNQGLLGPSFLLGFRPGFFFPSQFLP